MNVRYGLRTFGLELVMIAAAVAFLFPVYALVTLSLKDQRQVAESPLAPPGSPALDNYSAAWTRAELGPALMNSTVITVASLVALIALGSFAAYFLSRRASRLGYGLYVLFLLGIVLPFQLGMIPLFKLVDGAGLLGTYQGMIIFYTGIQLPFTIFLYTGFIRALPGDYAHAALIDGAGHVRAFTRVVFPLLRPVTGTVLILNAVFIWNDFFTPLLYLGGSTRETVPVRIFAFVGQYVSDNGLVFAGLVLASLPILAVFLVLQRYVIKGFASGLKG
ncbi:carbohydrate ABC transporter permease [Actinomadura madurae]|uniref:carbohydrate ABC transporter permease n=1 Tax=Actinomadura madurae TaxID=1993 RepID=UPI0020265F8D|nr:carbohydrate ABC transporter permease [Actinomadura madurae]MCP9949818.1 carbohydrate ABC transporter permease [Actinomadura madurae]MCP9979060.1 carbohydrate ABC transporter permease [Actinomadura madurae]MCQ0009413.1 carbohydrate ABC transporter permease [Actinomadura madurae]MCQ0015243.1 carbohydrate ABC transporter permease [Actinomadura madurae]URM95394.1 carbohydrate ABC transporter permease [Actinomadura madurae]